ncbi:elongation factor P [Candidatus Saccharibacteria bacterium]|nr:elongation factor P [Candidatus Saccharibacteria bacterium]
MFGPTDLKKNTIVQIDGAPFKVTQYNQKVVGRGGSIVNVMLKNLVTGAVIPKTFKGQEKIEPADVTSQRVQYLYNDGTDYFFMNPESFEQFQVPKEMIGDYEGLLKDGDDSMSLQFFEDKVINLEMPKNVYLAVTYTETVVKGDTTSSVMKDATLETGLVVKVPAFIKVGDEVSIDTETKAYRARKK